MRQVIIAKLYLDEVSSGASRTPFKNSISQDIIFLHFSTVETEKTSNKFMKEIPYITVND